MAAVSGIELKQALWRFVRCEILTWQVLVYVLLALTLRYWILPVTYAFLCSYLITPSGPIVWLTILGLTFWFVASFGRYILTAIQGLKGIKILREQVKRGEASESDLKTARQRRTEQCNARYFLLATTAGMLILPPLIASTLYDGIKAPPIENLKHPKHTTAHQRLEKELARWRHDGIFRTFDPD